MTSRSVAGHTAASGRSWNMAMAGPCGPAIASCLALAVTAYLLAAVSHAKKYDFDDDFYNQQLLEHVDDVLRPWQYEKDSGVGRRDRPRFRYKGGVLVARWYPARRGEPPHSQWSWEELPGVNQSALTRRRPYYPQYYRYCYYGYCRYYRQRYRGYGGYYGRGRRRFRSRGYGRGGYRGGFGGYAGFSRDNAFGRIVQVPEDELREPTSTPTASKAPLAIPDDDVEEIEISKAISKLAEATDEQLAGPDEYPGYMPFQEQMCCGLYEEASLLKQDALREHCYHRVFNTSRTDSVVSLNPFSCNSAVDLKHKLRCVHQCLWKARNLIGEDGQIAATKLQKFHRNSESEQWRSEIYDRAVTKCTNAVERTPSREEACPGLYLDMTYCLWEELQMNCPEKEWNVKSEFCNQLRKHVRLRRKDA